MAAHRLGLGLPLPGCSLPESVETAAWAERLGYDDVWSSEAGGWDGFGPLVAVAGRTQRMRLGVGIVSVFTRPPALIAMSAATASILAGGRFCLGLGSSTETIVEQWMGQRFDRPLTRVRETVEVVRRALRGERVSYEGRAVQVRNYRLTLPPQPVPVMLAALGPKMFRLAGEIGDGVIVVNAGPRSVPDLLRDFWAGVEASGRERDQVDVVCRVGVALDEDLDHLRPMLRRDLAAYGSTRPYNTLMRRQGFRREADAIRDAWARGAPREAAEAVSDRMVDELFVIGDVSACRAKLRAYRDAGVRTLVVFPLSAHPDPAERLRRQRRTLELAASWER